MKPINLACFAGLSISLASCVVLTYLWIDKSISLSYLQQSYEAERQSVEILERLVASEWRGMTEDAVLKKLEEAASKTGRSPVVVKREGDVIWFDQIRFNIERGKLSSVGAIAR